MQKKKAFLLPAFALGHTAHHLYTAIIPALLPIFKSTFNLTYVETALLPTAFQVGLTAQIIVGLYSDKTTKRSIIVSLGLAATAVAIAALSLANAYPPLLITSFLAGVAASTYHPAGTTLVTEHYPQKMGFALGIHAIGGGLGTSLGPIMLGALAATLTWQEALYIITLPGLITSLIYSKLVKDVWTFKPESQKQSKTQEDVMRRIAPTLTIFLAAYLMGQFAAETMVDFIPLYLTATFLVAAPIAAILLGLMRILGVIGGPIGGLIVDKLGSKRIVSLSFLGQAACILLLLQVELGEKLYLLLALMGLFFAIQIPAGNAYLAKLVPERRRGTAYAIFFTANVAWAALVPPISGAIIEAHSFHTAFTTAALICAVGATIMLTLKEPK
ncbi:MAG: MFS transporter [Nitrososphaerales archaeon]